MPTKRRTKAKPAGAASSKKTGSPGKSKPAAAKPVRTAGVRGGSLVVVESPAKARTIAPFLGSGYTVKASLGHVRDLPKSRLGVDVDHEFEPKYLVPKEKKAVVDDLKAALG